MKPNHETSEFAQPDEVMREVWQAKRALFAQYGNDMDAFLKGMMERQKSSGHPVAKLSTDRPHPEAA